MEEILKFFKALSFPIDKWTGTWKDWIPTGQYFFITYAWLFIGSAIIYLPMTFGIQFLMKKRKAFDLRKPLLYWNIFMSTFSGIGAIVTIQAGIVSYFNGQTELVCDRWCFAHPQMARWVFWFQVSKIIEFVDSLFIVLRKKELIFLHYYHHLVTMLFCWYAGTVVHNYNCSGYFFASTNYLVHFFMYGYYGFRAAGINPGGDIFITTIQIVQMLIGIYVLYASLYCETGYDFILVASGFFIYFSFFLLFLKMFYYRYIVKTKTKGE